jgi:hypothetical protein
MMSGTLNKLQVPTHILEKALQNPAKSVQCTLKTTGISACLFFNLPSEVAYSYVGEALCYKPNAENLMRSVDFSTYLILQPYYCHWAESAPNRNE